jgi:hypothetical protein
MFTSKTLLSVLAVACSTLSAAAQTASEPQFKISCEEGSWSRRNGENKRFCETRDLTMNAPAGQPLTIDGGGNGGITVRGWSGSTVRIRAKGPELGQQRSRSPVAGERRDHQHR